MWEPEKIKKQHSEGHKRCYYYFSDSIVYESTRTISPPTEETSFDQSNSMTNSMENTTSSSSSDEWSTSPTKTHDSFEGGPNILGPIDETPEMQLSEDCDNNREETRGNLKHFLMPYIYLQIIYRT